MGRGHDAKTLVPFHFLRHPGGHFGHLYINNVAETLTAASGELPASFDGTYYVYQGETDITEQVQLGGKGQYTGGRDATRNWDSTEEDSTGKVTFEDIDGLELIENSNGQLHAIIQEDSGNKLGERMFITSPLEHDADGMNLTYYFIAMSGGAENTRMSGGVSIPKGTACFDGVGYNSDAHEFSGIFELSGLIRKDDETGNFILSASDTGEVRRSNDRQVCAEKLLLTVLIFFGATIV
jgi:hypothetical protein